MLGANIVLAQTLAVIAREEGRKKVFKAAFDAIPPDEYEKWKKEYIASEKEADREATEERRHREMVAAIRSTGFWRF